MTGTDAASQYVRAFGARLRDFRTQQGLSLHDVERLSGGQHKGVVIASYERADRAVTIRKLHDIASFYQVEAADLLPPPAVPPAAPLVTATFAAITAAKDAEMEAMALGYERTIRGLECRVADLMASIPAEVTT
jgi:transcriptional regulator with XRE-family HTH domain